MYEDKVPRPIYYHDTWISIDPIKGCPYGCVYCVLQHADRQKTRPEEFITVEACVQALLDYRFYKPEQSYLAVGNETDMFHPVNQAYLLELLRTFSASGLRNPIALITKSPLNRPILDQLAAIPDLKLILVLSYSGLGLQYEPNFRESDFRRNFELAHAYGFPILHYWRPILPENSQPGKVREMLAFVSNFADATVFVGLKLHPALNRILNKDQRIAIPNRLMETHGEWLEKDTIEQIYRLAAEVCPSYPLYRHTSCAMASILKHHNKTATIYRADICPPSQCPSAQRTICQAGRAIPDAEFVRTVLAQAGKSYTFTCLPNRVKIDGELSQEEYAFLLHQFHCPLEVQGIHFENLYRGSIYENQKAI
jgi:DNA repair photolyase